MIYDNFAHESIPKSRKNVSRDSLIIVIKFLCIQLVYIFALAIYS